ncbi:MAG: class I SAM-dependent methyltransferase [Patescibacteria group bacterium]
MNRNITLDFVNAKKTVKKLYQGLGWPSLFCAIRFFTAPYARLASQIPQNQNGLIIDLGCGYGLFSNLLGVLFPDRQILGLELDKEKMKYADRGLPNVCFDHADITKTNLTKADCILLVHVLHHLNSYEEQETLIRSCVETLVIGGMLIICEVTRRPWWKFLLAYVADRLMYPGDAIYYRRQESMMTLLQGVGLRVTVDVSHQGTPFSHITYLCTKN